jgi:hypothetical protein
MRIRLGRLCAVGLLAWVAAPATARAAASNDRCLVCHVNFKAEELAVTHLKADIGCEQCHGISFPHMADEDGLTAPGKMFAKAKVAAFCSTAECHPKHSESVSAADLKAQVCTDCHGSHRMKVRSRGWDKETGTLIMEK